MRAATHLGWIVFGIAAPVAFTLWSTTDYGPRSRAHYEHAAAMRTDTRSVLERLAKAEGHADARIVAEGDTGLIFGTDGSVDLFTVSEGRITDQQTLVPQASLATDEPTTRP